MVKKQPRPKEFCPVCKIGYWMKADRKFILSYGKCQKCVIDISIGHPYRKPEPVLTLCHDCKEMTKSKNGFCTKCKSLKLYKEDFE